MKRLYVIGSSSRLAESISKLADQEYAITFYGRSNPFELKNYIHYNGVDSEDSVDGLSERIVSDIKRVNDVDSVGLVVLSGVSTNDWRESYLVNEYLPARISQAFATQAATFSDVNCSITLVSSTAAYQGSKLPYATTKASLTGILRTIAKDFKGSVRINIVLPSAFESGMIEDWDSQKRKAVAESNFIGRLGTPDDIAEAIMFAATNKFITNSIINMSGGTVGI